MRIVSAHALSKEGLLPLQPVDYCVVSISTLSNFINIGRGSLRIGVGGLRVRGCCQRILNLSLLVLILGQGCSLNSRHQQQGG